MEQRITEIEIKLAHLEQALNELNEVMVKHSDLIDRLNQRSERMIQQIELAGNTQSGAEPDDEKPPHY
jgi:SlyX protein